METIDHVAARAGLPSATVSDVTGQKLAPSAAPTVAGGMLAVIERVIESGGNVEVIERMLAVQERMMAKQAEIDFTEALARMKPKLPKIEKKGLITFTDKNSVERKTPHARYEDIQEAIDPHLGAEGFTISFDTQAVPGAMPIISCTLAHKGGHSKTISLPLPLDSSGSKNNLQAMGSTISYGKRYLVGMMFDLIIKGDDDDGAGGAITDEQAKQIKDGLEETGLHVIKFLKAMKVGDGGAVEDIRTKEFPRALAAIENKRYMNKKEAAKNANIS